MTAAAPAMSPFMSSIEPAGLIEMPPVSKTTPLPTKASGAAPGAPPFQRSTTSWLSSSEPWPTPSSARIPSSAMAFSSRISTSTPSFMSSRRAARELGGRQHIGWLVDQRAGEQHALGQTLRLRHQTPRGVRLRHGEHDLAHALGLVLVLLFLLGLV